MDERIKKHLPEHIELYYVDYNNNLNNHADLLQECVDANSLEPLSEFVYDWWESPTDYYTNEIRKAMVNDGLEELYKAYLDDIKDYLYDHDESDPVKDLLGNTGSVTCYYDLGLELDCGWHYAFLAEPWRNESIAQCAYQVRRKLGIKKDSLEAKEIYDMLADLSGIDISSINLSKAYL